MGKIVLASASPRRAEILEKSGISFRIEKPQVEENLHDGLSAAQNVMYLALKKALDVEHRYPGDCILAADTIVYKDEIIGKPADETDARRILKKLRDTDHKVITGVAFIDGKTGKKHVFYDTTSVYFRGYSDEYIEEYIANEPIWDKAGAYGIQEKSGEFLVDHIEGNYENVMGLPWYKIRGLIEYGNNRNFDTRAT